MAQHRFNLIIGLVPATLAGMYIIEHITALVGVGYAFLCGAVTVLVSYLIVELALSLLTFLFFAFFSIFIRMGKDYKKTSAFYNKILLWGYKYLCAVGRVRMNVSGIYKLNEFDGQKFMLVTNHRSRFDNFIQVIALSKKYKKNSNPIAYLSKKENFRIPVARKYMKRGLYISMDRGNMRSAVQSIQKAQELIAGGTASVGVFPEGTRSKTTELLEFKPGCFKIAQKTNCPVVVGVMTGTQNIHKSWPLYKTDVYFDIIKVFSPEELAGKKSVEISEMVRSEIDSMLKNPERLKELRG